MSAKYASSIQIIDAANPWPPRWFATAPIDSNMKRNNLQSIPVINASEQNGKIVFTNAIFRKYPGGQVKGQQAVLMCNRNLELTDTFYKPGLEIDVHDFAVNNKGEKLYFLVCDTIVDIRDFMKDAADSEVSISYEKIQIDNSTNETIFSWNPIEHLGLNAMYQPYCFEKSVINKSVNFEWSHANSLCWDKDGNILYSFKYIGIGKISRADGHTIWRVDRNKQKAGAGSDSLPIFLQHDLNFVKDDKLKSTYTVLSNGDSLNPHCTAYQFTVLEDKEDPHLKIVRSFNSPEIPQTGAGNYDVEANGNYVINYGLYRGDTQSMHVLFDYRAKDDKLWGRYVVLPQAFCYRIHRFTGPVPSRPEIVEKKGVLVAKDESKTGVWYELSGKDLEAVTKVSAARKFKPLHKGYYSLVVKDGIGYVVSKPFKYE